MTRASSASGFCVGCTLRPSRVLQPLGAGAERDEPVGAHLQIVVPGLQRVVVEGVALGARGACEAQIIVSCALVKRRPRKFGIGLALRQTMSLSIQKPRSCSDRADAEDVVVGADDPERGVRLHHAARGQQPGAGEVRRSRRSSRTCPSRRRRHRPATGRGGQRAFELEIVGRVGEDQVDAGVGKLRQLRDAVADEDAGRGGAAKAPSEQPARNARYAKPESGVRRRLHRYAGYPCAAPLRNRTVITMDRVR